MAFFSAASRWTTRLAPGALTTAGLAFATERGSARASNQAVSSASRHFFTTTARPWMNPTTTFKNNSTSFASKTRTTTTTQRSLTSSSSSSSSAATETTKTATTPTKSASFVEWYEGHLQARPIPTKMVTGSILWSLGDAVAQIVPPASAGTLDWSTFQYDWMRTGRAFTFGFVLHAPTSHAHFNFLEWMTVRAGVKGLGIPIFKAFMEQFV